MRKNIQGIHIGSKNYPRLKAGWLHSDLAKKLDSDYFIKKKFDFNEVINQRKSVFSAITNLNKEARKLEKISEVGLSKKPLAADLDVDLLSKKFYVYKESLPHGGVFKLKNIDLVDIPKVDRKVQKILDDELKAEKQVFELYKKNQGEEYITQLLSTHNLGLSKKFVPTKWSITAVDDMIAKNLKKELSEFDGHIFFSGKYLDNLVIGVMFPGSWSFEFVEIYGGKVESDFESHFGRKGYAKNTVGGYYAARLAVSEFCTKKKVSGRFVVFRFILKGYRFSLGVWVVREAVRSALKKYFVASDLEEVKNRGKVYIPEPYYYNFVELLSKSKTLSHSLYQTTLGAHK